MNASIIEAILHEELHRIAPDIDTETIERDENLREEYDIDSMDFLNLVIALSKRLEIELPETDYPRMDTYNTTIAYLEERSRVNPLRTQGC